MKVLVLWRSYILAFPLDKCVTFYSQYLSINVPEMNETVARSRVSGLCMFDCHITCTAFASFILIFQKLTLQHSFMFAKNLIETLASWQLSLKLPLLALGACFFKLLFTWVTICQES